MASIAKMSVQMGWNGEEAEKGAASMTKTLQKVESAANSSNDKMKEMGKPDSKEEAIFQKKLANMNELQRQQALAFEETKKRRMAMNAEEIKADIAKEKKTKEKEMFAESLKNMNALERDKALKDKETQKRRMNMTKEQILADIEAEKKKEEAKKPKAPGAGMFTEVLSGITLLKGAFDMLVLAPIQASIGILKLGGDAQATQIKLGYMAGSAMQGVDAFRKMQKQAADTGIPLASLTKSLTTLTGLGLSVQAAGNTMARLGNAVQILGGGAAGADAVAGSIAQLRASATATEGPLQQLQAGGLKVFEALAEELTKVTGEAYTVETAMQKVRDNAVMTSTAVAAVFRASNNPAAQAAADGIGATFTRQLDKLQEGFTAMLTSIGESLINALNPERVIAVFRGGMEGVKIIIDQISESLGLAIDPKKGIQLEKVFAGARDMTFEIAETLVKAGAGLAEVIQQIAKQVVELANWLANAEAEMATRIAKNAPDPMGVRDPNSLANRMLPAEVKANAPAVAALKRAEPIKLGEINFAQMQATALGVLNKARERAAAGDKAAAEAANKAAEANVNVVKGLKDVGKQEKQRVEDLEMVNKDLKVKTLDLMRANATAMEEFSRKITDTLNQVKQAAGADAALNLKFKQGLRRQVGKDLQQLIADFGTAPDQNLPTTMTKGSSAAVEQEIRASMQLTEKDFQSQLKAAMLNQARQSELQVERLDRLVAAADAAGVFAEAQLNEQKRIADAQKEAAANAAKNKPAVGVAPK